MSYELHVASFDSRPDIVKRFHNTPKYEVQLHKEVVDKLGLLDGDLVEISGGRTTAARVASIDKDGFDAETIGLSDFLLNNVQVSPEATVTIKKANSKLAYKITLAPIGKQLKKSELLKIEAKKSFFEKPFTNGDVTYLRSKILRYLPRSMTWLKVVTTEPEGIVVANEDTYFEIASEPIDQTLNDSESHNVPNQSLDVNLLEKNLLLNSSEWEKYDSLLKLGIFGTLTEAVSFFLHEGMKARNDIFEKSISVVEQITQLKKDIRPSSA